jgi:predicted DNA-binding protein
MLTAQQDARLDALANKTGMTVSEHLRRAVDSYFRLLDVAALRNPGTR